MNFPMDNFVFLETNRFSKDNCRSFLFFNPTKIISCYKSEDIENAFLELEFFISKGYYAAGFVSYEAGYMFEDVLKKHIHNTSVFPLMWFGIYKKPVIYRHNKKIDILNAKDAKYSITNFHANVSKGEYIDNVRRIKDFIKKGDTYQVNYTFKYKFDFKGSLYGFYSSLKGNQSVSYSGLIKTPEFSLVSLSPELFFRKKKDMLEVRPMKGTINRGRYTEEDTRNAAILKNCFKNRSENVMIVDLLRNDLGRISKPGTVKTVKLFEVEKYETLLQMISIVKSRLKKDIGIYDIFKAIFPSGSVTGAPKIRTMAIIKMLEKEPRNIYTGCIGFIAPNKEAIFNVAIRTVLIDNKTNNGELGIGSGIVYDSLPVKEFEECKLKANFITQKENNFKLIETILWYGSSKFPLTLTLPPSPRLRRTGSPEGRGKGEGANLRLSRKGYFLLHLHLDRLAKSAEYFGFKFDKEYISRELRKLKKRFKDGSNYKIRLLLTKDGGIELFFDKINNITTFDRARFSDKKTHSKDTFLYHKTTNRKLYDEEYKRWNKKGYFDIIFTNEKNQVTEGAISNIIIKKGRRYYTPPVECGLLNGVYRRYLLSKRAPLKEKILYKKDIKEADEIYLVNSVRQMAMVNLYNRKFLLNADSRPERNF